MKTNTFLMIILAIIFSNAANAQITTNPKLNYTTAGWSGKILVADWENYIQISEKTLDDFNKMQASITNFDIQFKKQQETIDKQQEIIKKQQEEISDMKIENKELKTEIARLVRDMNEMKKNITEIQKLIDK